MITPELWEDIVGLYSEGLMANEKGLNDVGVKFNKVTRYMALIKDLSTLSIVVSKGKGKERFGIGPL